MQNEYFKLDILSPVHVGTGEELDPMAYVMRSEADGASCHILDAQAWASDYSDPDELSEVFSGGNIPAIRGFLAKKINPEIYGLRRITVSNDRIIKEYEKKLSDRRAIHQLLFSPCMNTSNRVPFIPGSSIKGALRTAVIDWLDRNKHLGLKDARNMDNRGSDYHKRLEGALGRIRENAFKQLKISDVSGYADSTLLVEPLEVRRKEGKPPTPKSKCEVMPSKLLGNADQSSLYVRMSIGQPNNPSDKRLTLSDKKSWDWPELAKLVNAYFLKRFQKEKNKFYGLPNFSKARPIIEQLETELNADNDQMILRLGHYSQVEFVTIEDNQPLTRRLKDGTVMPYGTTRTLVNGLYPFGWVRLTPCNEEEYINGRSDCETLNLDLQQKREQLREKTLLDRTLELERVLQREEKARQEAEVEAKRQAELETMPEDERQLFLLEQGELNENQVVELFNQLDELEGQTRISIAKALKVHWQNAGKWKKKDCSKKQVIKVKKVKTVLGES